MIKTASFFNYTGPGRISIARFAPRGTPKGFRMFKQLAPGAWFNSVSREKYIELYDAEVLGKLDPQATWDALHGLADGADPVLLCWEKPEEGDKTYCHRSLVADWFERTLGHKVYEIGFEEKEHPLAARKAA